MRKTYKKYKFFSSLTPLKINIYICLFSLHKVKIWLLLNLVLSCKCLSDTGKLKDEDKKIKLVNKNITCWTGWTGNNLILMVWVLCYFVLQSSWGRTQTVIITESSQPPPTPVQPFVCPAKVVFTRFSPQVGRAVQTGQPNHLHHHHHESQPIPSLCLLPELTGILVWAE